MAPRFPLGSSQRERIRAGMDEWEKYTCIKMVLRTTQPNYVYIQDDNSGWVQRPDFIHEQFTTQQLNEIPVLIDIVVCTVYMYVYIYVMYIYMCLCLNGIFYYQM